MTAIALDLLDDPRIRAAVNEFSAVISQHFPGTSFSTYVGDDPVAVFLRAVVDVDDTDEVIDLIIDRLVALQVEEELPFHVLPVRTPGRMNALAVREHPELIPGNRIIAVHG